MFAFLHKKISISSSIAFHDFALMNFYFSFSFSFSLPSFQLVFEENNHWFHRRFNYYSLQTFLPNLRYVCLRLQNTTEKKYILWIVKGFSFASYKTERRNNNAPLCRTVCERKAEARFVDLPFSHPTSEFLLSTALVHSLCESRGGSQRRTLNKKRSHTFSLLESIFRTKHKLLLGRVGYFV